MATSTGARILKYRSDMNNGNSTHETALREAKVHKYEHKQDLSSFIKFAQCSSKVKLVDRNMPRSVTESTAGNTVSHIV